jgi:precorrin-3B methylase
MQNVFTTKPGTKNMLTERKFDVFKKADVLIDYSNYSNIAAPVIETAVNNLID